MDKDLKKQLQSIITGHRPRTLLGPFHGPNGDYYIRNRSLTYWELVKKLRMEYKVWLRLKCRHVFQLRHFRRPELVEESLMGYIIAGGFISFGLLIVIFYVVKLIGALL